MAANQEGDTAAARAAWQAALAISPRHREALLNLSGLGAGAGRYLEAKALVERVLAAAPDDPVALYFLARLERQPGDAPAADRAWARLIATHPAFADSVLRGSGGG